MTWWKYVRTFIYPEIIIYFGFKGRELEDCTQKIMNTYGHIKIKLFYHKQNIDTKLFCFRLAAFSPLKGQ